MTNKQAIYKDTQPIAAYGLSNNHSINILDIVYDGFIVIYRVNDNEVRQSEITYNDTSNTHSFSTPFGTIHLEDCIRINL